MSDNTDTHRKSLKRRFQRRAERTLDRDVALQNFRQQLLDLRDQQLQQGDASASDSSGAADSDEERVLSDEEVAAAGDIAGGEIHGADDGAVEEDIVDQEVELGGEADGEVNVNHAAASDSEDEIQDDHSSESDNEGQQPPPALEDVGNMTPEEKEAYLKQSLRQWACSGGVLSMRKVDELLGMLSHVFPTVPKSYKTLLETAQTVELTVGDNFKMWYKGIKANLDQLNLDNYINEHGRIVLDINMDGLPLPTKKFWPILGRLVGSDEDPFEIAIYHGSSDPTDLETFLGDFVIEAEELMSNGYEVNGNVVPVEFRNFILDAPARSLVKCCIGHGGYGACEKCCVVGEFVERRMNFFNVPENCAKRTDQSFRDKTDRLHHTGRSPLELLDIGMVTQFRLDSMHLVYKGVFFRLLEAILTWEGDWNLEPGSLQEISERLLNMKATCPRDFNRKARKLEDYYKMKVTELRRLLLYDGIVAFKGKFGDEIYSLFLLLHTATFILCNPRLLNQFADNAENFNDTFVTYSAQIFGQHLVVYNVHSLTHLTEECRENGVLESFSAFPYENRLKSIKETLRSGYLPLEQIAKRDSERRERREVKMKNVDNVVQLYQPRKEFRGQYRRICVIGVTFKVDNKDCCFMTDGVVFVLQNIIQGVGNNITFCGKRFNQSADFYTYPMNSSQLGILKVWEFSHVLENIPLNNVLCKCWLMQVMENEFVSVPINHSVPLLH